jgi:carboxymethylenebutenolidase
LALPEFNEIDPIAIQNAMQTVMQSQLNFQSGGKAIRIDAYLPETATGSLPAVVALHGAGGNVPGMERYANALAGEGFAVYVLHYFDRSGTTYADKAAIFRNFPVWMKTLWDAISFVETQRQVDRDRIALLGFSLGAYLSLATSAIDPRIRVVVEFFGGMPKEMNLFMRRLCPVLILHGEVDATVPVEEAYRLQKLLERKGIEYEMKIYPGEGHGFETEIWRDAGFRSLQFLKKYLVSSEAASPTVHEPSR